MTLKKTLALFTVFVAACVTPGVAQIFWTNQSPAGITDDIWSVDYDNGMFAATTAQGNILTSVDGLSWSSEAVMPGTWLTSITYGGGLWVVVGANGTILTSPDLKVWAAQKSPTTNKLNGVLAIPAVNPGTSPFTAVGDGGTILVSNDALTWTSQPSGVTGFLHGITYAINYILITGQDGVLLRGRNGVFTLMSSGTTQDLEAAYRNLPSTLTCVVGASGTIIHDTPWGSSLTELVDPFDGWVNAVVPPTSARIRGLAGGNGILVAAGEQGVIFTSTDGKSWTQRFSGDSPSTISSATLLSAAYSSTLQRYVITGTGGTILASSPPPTVFANVSTRGYVSSTQTLIGGFVIEGTAPRTVLIRADGPVLSAFGVPSPLPDPVLTVYDSAGTVIATDTGWTINPLVAGGVAYGTTTAALATAASETGAFALPNPSSDSALLLTLQPGAYTAQITSSKGNSGIALFESYTD